MAHDNRSHAIKWQSSEAGLAPLLSRLAALTYLTHSESDPLPAGDGGGNLGDLKLPGTTWLASAMLLRLTIGG